MKITFCLLFLVASTLAGPSLNTTAIIPTLDDCNDPTICDSGKDATCLIETCSEPLTMSGGMDELSGGTPETCCNFHMKPGIVVADPKYVDAHVVNPWRGGEAHNMYVILKYTQGAAMVVKDASIGNVITLMSLLTPGFGGCPAWVVFPEQQNKAYISVGGLTPAQQATIKAWTAAGGVLLHAYTAYRQSHKAGNNLFLETIFGYSNIGAVGLKHTTSTRTGAADATLCLSAANGAPATLPYRNAVYNVYEKDIVANGGMTFYRDNRNAGNPALSESAVFGIPYVSGYVIGLSYDFFEKPYRSRHDWNKLLRKVLAQGFCPRPGLGEILE